MIEWEIQRRSDGCVHCERIFKDQDIVYAFLHFENPGIVRKDYCEGCWSSLQVDLINKSWISYWKSIYQSIIRQEEKKMFEKDKIELLLRQWILVEDSKYKKLCYLLAVMLERKRILVEKKDHQSAELKERFIVYEKTKTGESFVLERPALSLSEIEVLQEELKDILNKELLGLEAKVS